MSDTDTTTVDTTEDTAGADTLAATDATATDATDTTATPDDTATEDATDWKAKYDQAVAHSRRHETQKKDNKQKLDAVLKALGMDTEEKVDPAKLAEDLTAAQRGTREVRVENAILRHAPKNGANADALTDSRQFMAKVADLDPAADDFTTQIAKAIKDAVKANPALGAQQVATKSGTEITGDRKAPPLDEQIAAAHKAGNHARVIELKQQQFRNR